MKLTLLVLALFTLSSNAMDVFIEPGVFVDMFDGESITYDNGTNEYSGTLRNQSLSYAIKFGLHYEKLEFGLESELYNLVGHFHGKGSEESFSKELQITYNSLFIGYEILPKQILYFSISHRPYVSSGTESYTEDASILSLEYAYHIKEWVSVNVKIESASNLELEGSDPEKKISYKDLILVGFSFPLSSNTDH